jgi:uncharacterized protein (DUF433 family)
MLTKVDTLVNSDAEIMNGEPVFVGTRVPVRTIAAWLACGESKKAIQKSFPTDLAPEIRIP